MSRTTHRRPARNGVEVDKAHGRPHRYRVTEKRRAIREQVA